MIINVLFGCYFPIVAKSFFFFLGLCYLIAIYLETFFFSVRETLERWARGVNRDSLEEW